MEDENEYKSIRFSRQLRNIAFVCFLLTLFTFWLIQLENVLKPIFISVAIYFVLKPGADYLSKNGFPHILSFLTMLMLFLLVVSIAGVFAYNQASTLVNDPERIADYNSNLNEKWTGLKQGEFTGPMFGDSVINETSLLGDDLAYMGILDEGGQLSDLIVTSMAGVGSFIGSTITVLFFLVFIILEANYLPGRIERAFPEGSSERVSQVRVQVEESVNTYIVVKTGVSFGTATLTALILVLFGIDLWFTWAMITFLMNYVPYIGSWISLVPPIALGLIIHDPATIALMLGILAANQLMWGNFIEPKWAGRALDLSPLVLLVVSAFSFWVWGIVGMVLAVPFAVMFKIVLDNIEATRPIAILLSEKVMSMERAWEIAVKDGNLSKFEVKILDDLQYQLGIDDLANSKIAAKMTIQRVQKKKKITETQKGLILSGARLVKNHAFVEELSHKIPVGALTTESQFELGELYNSLLKAEQSDE